MLGASASRSFAASPRPTALPTACCNTRSSPQSSPSLAPTFHRLYSTRAETKGYRLNHTMIVGSFHGRAVHAACLYADCCTSSPSQRVKDPEKSLKFYRDSESPLYNPDLSALNADRFMLATTLPLPFIVSPLSPPPVFSLPVLGMDLIDEHDADDFKLFFLAFPDSPSANAQSRAHREGILELTWNKGTEKQSDFSYHNGNDEPQGFGHTCISVPNLQEACNRLEKLGVEFKKRPQDGKMRKIVSKLRPDDSTLAKECMLTAVFLQAFAYDPDRYWVEIISTE